MNLFRRIFSGDSKSKSTKKSGLMGAVRAVIGGAYAGGWASDHREESKQFTGFNYLAVHAIANQVASATTTAFTDGDQQEKRISQRKALRKLHGSLAKYKSTYGQDDRETDPLPITHPVMKLMKRPNPYQTGANFRYRQVQQLRLTGTCYVWNVPSVAGPTCQRYVIPTAMTQVVQPTLEMPWGGLRVQPNCSRYVAIEDQGFIEGSPTWQRILGTVIDMREIQKIQYPHAMYFDDGQSPISACAQFTDLSNSVNTARTAQLRNGVDGSITITLPDDVTFDQDELDRYTERIAKKYGGPENVGRVMVLQNGSEVAPLSTTPKDMGYAEGFQDSKAAVLATHGTPEVATGFAPPGAYAAYTMSMMAWRHAVIQPICDMIAESDTEHLATQFGEGITIEIESDEVDDVDQTEKQFSNDVQARIRTLNELRTLRGLPRYPGPEGDQLWPPAAQPAAGAASGENGQEAATDAGGGSDKTPFPKTPYSFQSKALKAAIRAAEDGDFEWLSKLKAFNSNEARDESGKWTGGGSNSNPAETMDELRNRLSDHGVSHWLSEKDGMIKLDKIIVPKESRGSGVGTRAMNDMIAYADHTGKRIALTPDTSFGASSRSRLVNFYKQFGFKENKGRGADLSVSEAMIREPQVNGKKSALGLSTSTGSDGGFTVNGDGGTHHDHQATCPHCSGSKTFNARGKLLCQDCWKTSDIPIEATNGAATNVYTNGATV